MNVTLRSARPRPAPLRSPSVLSVTACPAVEGFAWRSASSWFALVDGLGHDCRGADRELEAPTVGRRERMSPAAKCRGDERRATVDERHCGERRRAVLEVTVPGGTRGSPDRCTYRCGQRHRPARTPRVRRRCEVCRTWLAARSLSNHVPRMIGLDDVTPGPPTLGPVTRRSYCSWAADDGVGD